jgi:hypothetical protein
MMSLTQRYFKQVFQILLIISFITFWMLSISIIQAAPRDDACNGKAVGQNCSYENTNARTGGVVEGICARGPNGGVFCGNTSEWTTCSSDPSAAANGDACQDPQTGQLGQCQARTTGSGLSQNTVNECVTAASGAPSDGDNPDSSSGAPNDGGDGAPNDGGGGAPNDGGSQESGNGSTAGSGAPQPQPQSVQFNNPITATSIPELIATIIRGVLGLLGAVAVAIIVYAGFTYMTAGGNASKTAQATTAITNAVIGLVVIMGAFLIVDYVISAIVG